MIDLSAYEILKDIEKREAEMERVVTDLILLEEESQESDAELSKHLELCISLLASVRIARQELREKIDFVRHRPGSIKRNLEEPKDYATRMIIEADTTIKKIGRYVAKKKGEEEDFRDFYASLRTTNQFISHCFDNAGHYHKQWRGWGKES